MFVLFVLGIYVNYPSELELTVVSMKSEELIDTLLLLTIYRVILGYSIIVTLISVRNYFIEMIVIG
jgi:hypothetical protein